MKRLLLTLAALATITAGVRAQRMTDKLDRGLVAVPSGSGNFVSWRIFGEEYYDTEYNLYRDGVKVNNTPLKVSNYTDNGGKATSKYQVAAVVRGVEQAKSAEVTRWTHSDGSNYYHPVAMKPVTNRNGVDVTSDYIINDVSLGDVTGNGVSEFIVKRNKKSGVNASGNKTDFHHYECYDIDGNRLWWIDMGPNMMAGPDEQWDLVAFDWDEDGKAECVLRGADNMIIHTAGGKTINIGDMNYYAPRDEYTHQGAEYLLYLNGETGEPFAWDGESDNWTPMAYPLPRFESGESDYASVWGSADTGHRSCKHYFGAPCLDGRHYSIFLGRGCYTRHKMCALDVNPETHELTQRWRWNEYSGASPWFGNGFHNFAIADVDWDGRDEIVFGSMIIDDNGLGLCTTGLGHGDAQHCSDLDPFRHGQEQFVCNETSPACTYFNATTGKIYYRLQSNSDDGRALCANFTNQYPGSVGRSTQTGMVSTTADKIVGELGDFIAWSDLNNRIYWDGDLCDEVLNSPGTEREAVVIKPGSGRIFQSSGCKMNNDSKNNPSAQGDILGDWREEIVIRTTNTELRIYTTSTATSYRIPTLWHDHQYRNAMVWQCVGYNQPPHPSFFLGQLEGITMAPPPLTMTGRTEVANGGTINTTLNGQHVLVCETNDTHISVAEGAQPWVATFNVPSWVQGTNSPLLNGQAKINYEYYTCDVEGAAFSGSTRLVKQGDGILNLPAVDQQYTGETSIWAGTVNFDGKMLHTSLWMNRFAELNSDGGEFRSITMNYDAKLRPGREGHIGTITTDSLVLGIGARVIFDVNSEGLQADQVNTRYLSIETKNWQYGPKYLQPIFEFVIPDGQTMATGRYLIGTAEKLKGSISNIRIEGTDPKQKAELALDEGKLFLVVSGIRDAGTVTWTGASSNIWNMASAENFSNGDGGSDIFVTGDNVHFNDNASIFNVNLNGDLEADTVFVDNSSKAYTFSGNGALVGNTTLVKQGSGTLTIRNDNSYTGGNRLSGGVVAVSSLANANQALGNLGGVTTTAAKFIIENGAELRTTAAVTNGSTVRFETEEGGIINNSADYIVARAMQGTKLTKKGSGTMKLNVSNTQLTRLVLTSGTVACVGSTNTPAKTVELQGGTLNESTGSNYAIEVASGKSATWNLVNDATYTNKLTGQGTITISCPVRSGGSGASAWYATRTHVAVNLSGFEGTLKPVSNGDPGGRFTLDTSAGMPNGTMSIAAGVEVQNSGKTFRIGRLAGTGSLGGSCTFSNGTSVGANTWQVGNDANWSFSGKVTSNANFTKVGSGKITWSGSSDNTGATNINEGEIGLMTKGQLGTGALNIGVNGTLSGTNQKSAPLKNSAITIRGTLRPGLSEGASTGILYIDNKNVTLSEGGVLTIGASSCATALAAGCTTIEGINKLTLNGTIRIVPSTANTLQKGDSIRIFSAATVEGTPTFDMQGGIEWDTSRLNEGLLFVKDINTGISNLVIGHSPRNIYDMHGRLVRANATSIEGLPAGIYVCEGRKFVIK